MTCLSAGELAGRHTPAPTIAAAHQLRLISGTRGARQCVTKELQLPQPKRLAGEKGFDVKSFVEDVRLAVYGGILGAYIQGLNVSYLEAPSLTIPPMTFHSLRQPDRSSLRRPRTKVGRSTLPVSSGFGEQDALFSPTPLPTSSSRSSRRIPNSLILLESQKVADELSKCFNALKRVCMVGIESDSTIPSLDATLGWIKTLAAKELPTSECRWRTRKNVTVRD